MRMLCLNCREWMTGKLSEVVVVQTPNGHTRRGDLHSCPTCGTKVVADFGEPFLMRGEPDCYVNSNG